MKTETDVGLGLVIKDRWEITEKTLISLNSSRQRGYDLYLVDNGSCEENINNLKSLLSRLSLPLKHLFLLDELPISKAFNLPMYLSRNYKYRVKMDNDVLISHDNTKFIKVMVNFISEQSKLAKKRKRTKEVDMVSILPIPPNWFRSSKKGIPLDNGHLIKMFKSESLGRREFGKPYLFGCCMLISKRCFDRIGYFDERLWRRIDIEYCHRLHDAGFYFGYAPNYWLVHIGAGASTEGKDTSRERYRQAKRIATRGGKRQPGTVWEGVEVPDSIVVDWRGSLNPLPNCP